jgi:fructosamine-3-kinase
MHRAGADSFGALPPGIRRGYIAELALPDGQGWEYFGPFYARARLEPFAATLREAELLTRQEHGILDLLCEALSACDGAVCGPVEAPSRVHGDLWSGNVLWRRRDAVLIDPSAHGGHREGDLAMLALFGLPFLDEVFEAYEEAWPLAPGWRDRQPLHQIYPLLVHGVLFGGSYPQAAVSAARTVLR